MGTKLVARVVVQWEVSLIATYLPNDVTIGGKGTSQRSALIGGAELEKNVTGVGLLGAVASGDGYSIAHLILESMFTDRLRRPR